MSYPCPLLPYTYLQSSQTSTADAKWDVIKKDVVKISAIYLELKIFLPKKKRACVGTTDNPMTKSHVHCVYTEKCHGSPKCWHGSQRACPWILREGLTPYLRQLRPANEAYAHRGCSLLDVPCLVSVRDESEVTGKFLWLVWATGIVHCLDYVSF